MKLEAPDRDALLALAREHGFELSDAETELFGAMLGGSLASLSQLDEAAATLTPPEPERHWWEPEARDNPHGAWFVRCEIEGREGGPLAGLRFAAKDNVMVAGLPMLNGSSIFEGFTAELDASVVRRLLEAGATLAGKAHCEQLCLSGGSHTNTRGPVHNPRRHGHTSGGSSSGSAALVAAGEVELAIGGDQGGSIRVPAALCGVVGMKPTFGLVPYTGVAPIEASIDHVGPITANVRDNARMLEAMAGPDGVDMRQSGAPAGDYLRACDEDVRGLRVALLREGFSAPGMQPEVASRVRAAAERLAALGCEVEEVSVPEHAGAGNLAMPLLMQGLYRTLFRDGGQGSGRTDFYAPRFLEAMSRWREHAADFSGLLKFATLTGAWLERQAGTHYYALAANLARASRAAYDLALRRADALLMPTCPMVAPPLPGPEASLAEQIQRASETTPNTLPFDATHHPALSVPWGEVDGLPVGAMLVGRHLEEALLYRIGQALESSTA